MGGLSSEITIGDATIEVTQNRFDIFTAEGSGSEERDPGSYRVNFESKTSSGWMQTNIGPQGRQIALPETISYAVKADETTTAMGNYVKETSEPPDTPESATMHVKAHEIAVARFWGELKKIRIYYSKIKFEWNGEIYKTPKTFTVEPGVEQRITFHYNWCKEEDHRLYEGSKTLTKTFAPGEDSNVLCEFESYGIGPVNSAYGHRELVDEVDGTPDNVIY